LKLEIYTIIYFVICGDKNIVFGKNPLALL